MSLLQLVRRSVHAPLASYDPAPVATAINDLSKTST